MLDSTEVEFFGFAPSRFFRELFSLLSEVYRESEFSSSFEIFENMAIQLFKVDFPWERMPTDELVELPDISQMTKLREEIQSLNSEHKSLKYKIDVLEEEVREYRMLNSERLLECVENAEELKKYLQTTSQIHKAHAIKQGMESGLFTMLMEQSEVKNEMRKKERKELFEIASVEQIKRAMAEI